MAAVESRVVDLFSGGGGMSYGFAAHPQFSVVGAADAEIGKPSTGMSAIGCNATYHANMGVVPFAADLGVVSPAEVASGIGASASDLSVLLACPPCTGFSRAVSKNYTEDDPRNSLVVRVAEFVDQFSPQIVMMENVPQLLNGKFREHFQTLAGRLRDRGYSVHASVHRMVEFGLPQQRERAIVIAVKNGLPMHTLEELWDGYSVDPSAATVRRAISHLPRINSGETDESDPAHTSTTLVGESLERLKAMPRDGGSWPSFLDNEETHRFMIPSMWKAVERGRLNSYCDVYGRMWWDRPAPTIKRECSHIGNGRYSHPEQDRQCTVRELAILQGFPNDYKFVGTSRKNLYRQVGDAVPPLISYQLAWVASWILTDEQPDLRDVVLPRTSLTVNDIQVRSGQASMVFC
ncbi:DNA cytosine methyltransferase [Mycolicibacterium sp. CBM1]